MSKPPLPFLGTPRSTRFMKFGIVGSSGILVNFAVLYLCQEILFKALEPRGTRLSLSLATAIFVSTISNFFWNRLWTWGDRKERIRKSFLLQIAQYFLACWLSIVLQFVFTKILAHYLHYLVANLIAIAIAALINFLANDAWTFAIGHNEKSGQARSQEKER
jgi:dolichol-phosphate mannosyltransferase